MNSSIKNRIASFAIVWCLVFSLFAGLMVVVPSEAKALLPSILPNGDVVIGSDYEFSSWPTNPDLNGANIKMKGNLTVRAGGTVTIIDGTLSFAQDIGLDRVPGTPDDHIYTLIVEDGGRLVLNHATLTTHLDYLCDFPSLGVLVQNGGSFEATDSVLKFPGLMVVDASQLTLTNTVVTGHAAEDISTYCLQDAPANQDYFPVDSFDDSAVIYAVSSTCNLINSRVERIYEGDVPTNPEVYNYAYAFATDDDSKDLVSYTLARHVDSFRTGNTALGTIANLTADDTKYVSVALGNTLALGSVDINGLTFPASASYNVVMNVKYLTDLGYDGTNPVQWSYENGAVTPTTIVPSDTHLSYDPSVNIERTETFTMPSMSAADLRNLNVTFVNNAVSSPGNIYFNKIWFDISFQQSTYRDITFAGSTSLTAIDTYFDVDFHNDTNTPGAPTHNQLNVIDSAKAYLYGVYGDTEEETNLASRVPAYFIEGNGESLYALSKNAQDNTTASLSSLRAVDGAYYSLAGGRVLAIENFNPGDLIGPLTAVSLSVSVRTAAGYVVDSYVQWGTSWSSMSNTAIRPFFNGVTPDTFTFDLFAAGVTDIATLNNLKIKFTNTRPQAVQFDRITVTIETGPAIYNYRWAEVTANDQQGLPISGAYANASLLSTGGIAYYYTPAGVQLVPPTEVLNYLSKNAANFAQTNDSGAVRLPLLSERMTSTADLPNLYPILGYNLDINYTNISGIFFTGSTVVSFDIYPAISQENATSSVNYMMPGLFLDKPDLQVSSLAVNPTTVYVGDATTVSVFVLNAGLTGATNVVVNLTDSLSGLSTEKILDFVGPGATEEVQFLWTANPAGLHTLTARVDPKNAILEGNDNNNERSLQVNVLANLPELSVIGTDISSVPQPAFSGSPVTTTVLVSNALGRANANNVTVSFYIGDPRTSGQLIGTTLINVTSGAANTTTLVWTPSEIGTYDIFVWVNKERSPAEYTYSNNLASRSIIVDLSIQSTDLVVDDNDVLVFSGTNFNHRGRIIVMDQGTLIIRNAMFTVDQDFDNQFQVYVMDSGRIILEEATFTSTNLVWIYMGDGSKAWVNDSTLAGTIKVKLDGASGLSIDGSSIGAEIVAPTSSSASMNARDSSFSKPLSSFGGNARANMISVSIPSINAKESSIIYHYRTIEATVTDEANNIIVGATVQLRWYVNGTLADSGTSGVAGIVSFDALCDVITSAGAIYYGTYFLNCSYSFMGTSYYADNMPVSLQPYSSPLTQDDPQVTLVLNGVIPISSWDLIIDDNNVVTLEGTTFTHRGRIIIMDSGILRVIDGGLVINQESDFEFQIFVQDSGKLDMSGASLSSNRNIWLYASGNSQIMLGASLVQSSVLISLADNAILSVADSTVGSDIVAPTGSSARVWAWNSTFQNYWTSFGGNARAYLTSVSMPAISPIEGAVVYHFRWIEVQVLDGNNYPLPHTVVQIRYYFNDTLFDSVNTGSSGEALFAALCDRIDASNNNFLGNYRINATYWFAGQPYQTEGPVPVSLTPYGEPLVAETKAISVSIPGALPDLDPPLIPSTSNPYRGDDVTLTTYVRNSGVVDANNVLVRFKDGSTTISEVMVQKIVPGATATIQTVWQATYPLGQHNISMIVDPENAIKELNKNDNTNWTLINVRGIADLYVSTSDLSVVPLSPTTNSSASVALTVHNSGDIAAVNVNVSFVDIRPSGAQVLLGYRIIPNIPALGGTGTASLTWIPNVPGNHQLVLRVNVGVPPIAEHTTSDNNITFPVTVLNYADLSPTGTTFRPATAIYVNNQVSVDAAVTNIGQTGAANVVVNFWEGAVGTGRLFDTQQVSSIAAGQTVVVTGTWSVQPAAGGKIQTRTITVDVNPSRTVTETNYNNNRLAQVVTVIDNRPDLQFVGGMNVTSGGTLVDEAVVGESLLLKVKVKNDGFTKAMSVKIRFEAEDNDSFVTHLGTVSYDLQANETIDVSLPWIVNVTTGNFTLRCTLDSVFAFQEISEINNVLERAFKVNPPDPAITGSTDKSQYVPDNDVIVTGKVTNARTRDPLVNINVKMTLVDANTKGKIGDSITVQTSSSGDYQGSTPIPSNAQPGLYAIELEVTIGNKTVQMYTTPFEVKAQGAETALPFLVWVVIIIVVLLVIIGFSFYLYKYQLGRMVECGECGALIAESSKKCPKCGVEFETGTAKCSQCGAWIPASSSECPECGAKFVTEPLAEEESEYVRKMREQYEGYVNPYREQAKQVLGKKYSEAKFQEWWKKQPSYISFEKWLSQEEEKRKSSGAAFPCPVCGTPNPKGSNICSKCGTVFEKATVAEAGAAEPMKPTRRIVRRPAEKKAIPKKPEEGGEQPSEQPLEEPKNP